MQIYIVRYNPFLYHLGLKLNVKPFPIICALLCLERNKYGKERFIVGCLVFIKWYVWSLTKEFKFSSILQTRESVISVAFSASSWRFPRLASFQGSTSQESCPVWGCRGSLSSESTSSAGAVFGAVQHAEQVVPTCPLWVLQSDRDWAWQLHPLVVVLPTAALSLHWLRLGCLQLLQFHRESCYSCGCFARDPDCMGRVWKSF